MYDSAEIASNINKKIKEKGISQRELLEKAALSKNAISSMLSRGSMLRADNLAKIADCLDCSIDSLMGRSHYEKKSTNYINNISDADCDLLSKLHTLSVDSQDAIIHMINYQYEQLIKKRKENLSPSGSSSDLDTSSFFA